MLQKFNKLRQILLDILIFHVILPVTVTGNKGSNEPDSAFIAQIYGPKRLPDKCSHMEK